MSIVKNIVEGKNSDAKKLIEDELKKLSLEIIESKKTDVLLGLGFSKIVEGDDKDDDDEDEEDKDKEPKDKDKEDDEE